MPKLTLSLFVFLLAACNFSKTKTVNSNQTFQEFKSGLQERKIGDTKLYISLPENYLLKSSDGSDFSVYYFSPIDTSDKVNFSGGMYFGSAPSEFKPDSDCAVTYLKANVLGRDTSWKVFDYKGKYFVQVIIAGNDKIDQFDKIHVFGDAKNKSELEKMLYVFSTLKQKN